MRTINPAAFVVTLALTLVTSSRSEAQPAATWGITLPTSQNGEAQRRFVEGVTAMHLHMYEDAEDHFLAAQKLVPDFVMAYWGEALNQHRTIWSYHNRDKALAALAKLGPTPEARLVRAKTPRERDYMAAVDALFGSGTQRERELAYALKMRALSAAHPDDLEALAWYCLSLMRIDLPGLTRQQTRMEMASLALKVLQRNAKHPGANRYLIQSTDDPTHTAIGWIAVSNLKAVRSTGAEVIHVPSHVYLQHGLWNEVADANRLAFDASMAWVDAHGWKLADLNLHNYGHLLNFLNYAYLESGQLEKAAGVRDRIRKDFYASGKAAEIRRWFIDVHARCIVELAEWGEVKELAATMREEKLGDTPIWLAIGIGAARTHQLDLAREALAFMPKEANGLESLPARELRGLIAFAEGQKDVAVKELAQAAAIDQQATGRIGTPPTPVKPANELYGEVLAELGRDKEALEQFEVSLTLMRRRPLSLLGAARASQRLGLTAKAAAYYQELRDVWKGADADHPFLAEVRRATNN